MPRRSGPTDLGDEFPPAAGDGSELDGAMHSVWLHGHWRRLTRQMTTAQREAAWAAVKRYSATLDPDAEPLEDVAWAWWRP